MPVSDYILEEEQKAVNPTCVGVFNKRRLGTILPASLHADKPTSFKNRQEATKAYKLKR